MSPFWKLDRQEKHMVSIFVLETGYFLDLATKFPKTRRWNMIFLNLDPFSGVLAKVCSSHNVYNKIFFGPFWTHSQPFWLILRPKNQEWSKMVQKIWKNHQKFIKIHNLIKKCEKIFFGPFWTHFELFWVQKIKNGQK